jgi:D-arginine dehydrogenase
VIDVDVDVAVVGGGMAGMSVAAELASTHSVAVLEQENQLAHHATGRSAAAFLESYGSPEVRALTRASRPLIESADTPTPLLTPRPLLWIAAVDDGPALDRMVAEQPGLQVLTPAEARKICPVVRDGYLAGAALEPDAQDIDVAALHQVYVRRAQQAGVVVLRASRLVGATRKSGRWLLHHSSGDLTAGCVVNAAGAWADEVGALLGARRRGLEPLRRTIAIARAQPPVDPAWPLVADVDEAFYFRPEGPHVLLSPADETPSPPCDARPDEADVALAIERVNAATTLGIRSVVTTWAGLRTFAPDRNPVVGPDPDVPDLIWLAGQGGYGIQTAPALARLTATTVLSLLSS